MRSDEDWFRDPTIYSKILGDDVAVVVEDAYEVEEV